MVGGDQSGGRTVSRTAGREDGRAGSKGGCRSSVGRSWLVGRFRRWWVGLRSVGLVSVDASSCFVCLSVVPIGQSITCDHRPLHLVLRDRHSCMCCPSFASGGSFSSFGPTPTPVCLPPSTLSPSPPLPCHPPRATPSFSPFPCPLPSPCPLRPSLPPHPIIIACIHCSR